MVFISEGKRLRLSLTQRSDIWSRWKSGQSLHEIGRAFGKPHSCIRCLLLPRGGLLRRPAGALYTGLPDIDYPLHDKTIVVTRCGRICLGKKKINFSTVFAGKAVGIKEVHDDIWLVSFMDYDLGYIDLEEKTLQPLDNPFGPRV
jgi:hypothetical protein